MASIATTVLATDRAFAAALQSTGTGVRHAPATSAAAANRATSVELSGLARSLFGAFAGQAGATGDLDPLRLPESFDAMVQARTEAFAAELAKDFAKDGMMLDVEISLHVDSSGTITAKGPYKERIEKYLRTIRRPRQNSRPSRCSTPCGRWPRRCASTMKR